MVSLYMDHHVPSAITAGLRKRGVDVLTAEEDGSARLDDDPLLDRATSLGRVLFSQDQDLSEVADEMRLISKHQMRWIRIACAFPDSPARTNRRGINGTEWIKTDRSLYDSCIDARDYRPKKS